MLTGIPAETRQMASVPEAGPRGDSSWADEPERASISEGSSCYSVAQSCLLFPFSKRSRKSVFLCEISQYLNTLQAKQNTATSFDLCFIIENACFCSVKLMNAQLREGIWRLVLDCAPQKAADPIPNP